MGGQADGRSLILGWDFIKVDFLVTPAVKTAISRPLNGGQALTAGAAQGPSRWTTPAGRARRCVSLFLFAACLIVAGCGTRPRLIPAAQRKPIDRAVVEFPSGFVLERYAENLTAPTAITFDGQGSLIIAEAGFGSRAPAIYGFKPDGTRFDVYRDPQLPFSIGSPRAKDRLYGPIGGMIHHDGKLYVSHRDRDGKGVITAIGLRDGTRSTIVAGMPAQGDYGLTDLAIKADGRMYFGIGTATNSGVVGLDNWAVGWVRQHPKFHDQPWAKLRTRGVRMDSRNPMAGLFGPGEKAVTGAFQPFDTANKSWIYPPQNGKYNGAIYSVALDGGDLRAEAFGIRLPRGLAFDHVGGLFFTNNGMELRGTRPVKDDPDVLCRLLTGTWYGWPDYTADFNPVTDEKYQPGIGLIVGSGFDEVQVLIDHDASGPAGVGLRRPSPESLLRGSFPSQSGAAKLVMAPTSGPFERFQGSAIVALSGDRAPFATGGQKTVGPIGYKVARVSVDNQQVEDFIRNTGGKPAHLLHKDRKAGRDRLERPVDVKLSPDRRILYVLDMGRMEIKNGKEHVYPGTGQVYRLIAGPDPGETAQPAGESEEGDALAPE